MTFELWLILVLILIIVFIQVVADEDEKGKRLFYTFIALAVILGLSYFSIQESKNPLGVNEVTQGEVLKILAVDTTNNIFVNVMVLDGSKKIYTYAIKRNIFERLPRQGERISLLCVDKKERVVFLK